MTSAGPREADSSLGGHKRNLARTKTQRKGAVTPQETEPKLHDSVGDLLWRPGPAETHHGDGDTGRVPVGINPLRVCH